ncbi:hypothetical protein [Paenibacillus sp. PL91]|uniref:hypothetical protein n=1 Tax=Paenibacillus sp. PL91 TaxID=2729538 RepID=UPI00398319E6
MLFLGEELQSEYFVPRHYAYQALCAIDRIRDYISPHLYVSEIHTIAEDNLWMSPCYKQDSVAIHFTWKADWNAVRKILPLIEEQNAPFLARPYCGKLFAMQPFHLQSLYEKLPYFPQGKFCNSFFNKYIMDSYS